MVRGDKRTWINGFRSYDQRFLQGVMQVWRTAIALLPMDSDENAITAALVTVLRTDSRTRGLFYYYDYQFVPLRLTEGQVAGQHVWIDLAAIIDREGLTYVAYECKKLNVRGADGARRSRAGAYVGDDGMMCFITEKYAKDLPFGGMLGYVMDGDLDFAYTRIKAKIMSRRSALGLQAPPRSVAPIDATRRFVTEHMCDGRWMEMRHALLPFVESGPTAAANHAKRGSVSYAVPTP